MNNTLEKKYGLFTAISMVVGIVIGSGIFFKAQNILNSTNGNMPLGILAWLIGGAIMMICAYCFATLATVYDKSTGLIDYAAEVCGPKYAYLLGWFFAVIYTPCITSTLAWVSARYTLVVFGDNNPTSGRCLALTCLFLIASYALNFLSPVLAGKFQVSTTVIKLVPIILMAVVGTLYGLFVTPESATEPLLITNFQTFHNSGTEVLFGAVVSAAFAYEGWILATSISGELKDAKKNLPLALLIGCAIVMLAYILYYIGVAGGATVDSLIENGATQAFTNLFTKTGGVILNVFVAVSCMGTLNGLVLSCSRNMYSIANRNQGPKPEMFSRIDSYTNIPTNSSVIGLLFSAVWLFYFYAANLDSIFVATYSAEGANALVRLMGTLSADGSIYTVNWFGFDSSELPIVALYALYIPLFFGMMKLKELSFAKRVIFPILALLASLFMIVSAIYAHKWGVMFFIIVCAVIMAIGIALMKKKE